MTTGLRHLGLLCLAGAFLAACSTLPASGPRSTALRDGAALRTEFLEEGTRAFYALVPLTPRVVAALPQEDVPPRFQTAGLPERPQDIRIGVGDVVNVTIFEARSGGLFIPDDAGSRPGNFVQLPPQQVGLSGRISVPFGGAMRVLGLTPAQVAAIIERSLANRALEPQVVVSLGERRSNEVSVLGDVASSQRFSLDPSGERVLGAIARAGGPRFPAYETMVTLQRDGTAERALLSEIASRPEQNIRLRGGDVVFVAREPRYFQALGALGQGQNLTQLSRRLTFDDARLTLSQAIARAGGLQDDRAGPASVFLFRTESAPQLARLGLPVPAGVTALPTVYLLDMSEPGALFLAERLWMRESDVLYVSNAPAVEFSRFLQLLLPFTQSGSSFRGAIAP